MVGGDEAPGAAVEKITRDRHCQGRSFFRVGGRAQLIEQHQGGRIRQLRDALQVGDVGGEGREVLLDRLGIADIGQKRVERGNTASVAGTGIPAWAIMPSNPVVLSATVLPPVLGR